MFNFYKHRIGLICLLIVFALFDLSPVFSLNSKDAKDRNANENNAVVETKDSIPEKELTGARLVKTSDTGGEVKVQQPLHIDEQFVVGKVISVTPAELNGRLLKSTGMVSKQQLVTVEVKEGPFAGMKAKVLNEITDNPAFNVEVKPGSEVILSVVSSPDSRPEINIADYNRTPAICWLLVVFLVAFLVFGGKTGLKSLAGLAVSIGLVALVLLPLSMKGVYPLLTATVICLITTTTTMLFISGFSRKAFAAIAGTVCGVIIAGIAAHLVIVAAPLTGLSSEEAQILRGSVLSLKPSFYTGLLAAGMLIGALGVIMDVGISVASAVQEVAKTNAALPASSLYNSGMNVGRDIMGTMTNTLILAYAGGALPLLLLASQMPSGKLINLDLVATEVTSSLSGSLGLVCTIPLTALFSAILMANRPIDDKEIVKRLGSPQERINSGVSLVTGHDSQDDKV
jgi:uncharacterized membrane protein